MSAPVERKVQAATAASVVTAFLMGWILTSAPALSAWAGPLQGLIEAVVTGSITFVVAWMTSHTPRPASNDQTYRPGRM
jgi:ABC-type enterochelin transport system permease subunit